jgi:mono/diheme cytochrome c family protein
MAHRLPIVACLALALACAATSSEAPPPRSDATSPAIDPVLADPVLAELGEPVFRSYCASCHGLDGRGNGPAASALNVPPADLRRIAAHRGGHFPDAEIARKIDGRFDIDAHGTREMPVWGTAFGADIPEAELAESVTRGRLAVLIEYLKSIQVTDELGSPEATREEMDRIFAAMAYLLPRSLDATRFEDPAEAASIQSALDVLDRSSSALGQHGASQDASFAHLSRSLAIDARDIRIRYAEGHPREARYLVQTLTETCVACHSRLPSGSASYSDAFAREAERLDLSLPERAKLAYATRQFDVAAELYEQLLGSPEFSANDIDLNGHLADYLELEIRVHRDLDRPAAALERFRRRDDLSPVLRSDVDGWITALHRLSARQPSGAPVDDAAALVGDDEHMAEDGKRLVDLLEASGVLHRALAAGGLPQPERARAYYLLGVVETRIGRSYWLSEAEAYLETAIRLAPGQPVARRAYALLDEFLVAGYSGSGGTHVPPDLQAKLDRLRAISEGG